MFTELDIYGWLAGWLESQQLFYFNFFLLLEERSLHSQLITLPSGFREEKEKRKQTKKNHTGKEIKGKEQEIFVQVISSPTSFFLFSIDATIMTFFIQMDFRNTYLGNVLNTPHWTDEQCINVSEFRTI